jgi:ribosome-associated heat shock protein Hsp15
MRLDRLLFFLRFSKSRNRAQAWIGEGHIRRNGVRVECNDQPIEPGDVLTLPLTRQVMVIEILSLPARRGPAEEAVAHYRALDAGPAFAIAGVQSPTLAPTQEGLTHS